MAQLFKGTCNGKVLNPEIGTNKRGVWTVKWEMEVVDGPHAGKRASYSGKLDEDGIKWTKADMLRVGWQGKSTRTFVEDVKAANKILPFSAEIATYEYKDSGKTSQWTAAKFNGGGAPLKPFDNDKLGEVDRALAEAQDIATKDDSDLPF
jgi:hypothetical protein